MFVSRKQSVGMIMGMVCASGMVVAKFNSLVWWILAIVLVFALLLVALKRRPGS